MTIKQWFVLCQCRGCMHPPCLLLGCLQLSKQLWRWQRGKKKKSVMPIKVPREKGKRRWVLWREEERKEDWQGETRGYKWERKNRGLTLSGWTWAKQKRKVNTCGTNKSEGTREVGGACRDSGRQEGRRSDRGRVKSDSLPSGTQLQNGASLEKKVMLQTRPTGDPDMCGCMCQREKKNES